MGLKHVIHASIRRLPEFINAKAKYKENKKLKLADVILLPLGIVRLFFLYMLLKMRRNEKYKLGIVAIVKDEGLYIQEWLDYYISLGVEHFYIYDNGSKDNLLIILKKYQKYVTYIEFTGKARQMDAYNDALNRFGKECHYLAFLDIDEYVYIKGKNKLLSDFLDYFFTTSHQAALVINWQIFGSSHLKVRPEGLVTDNYLYKAKEDFPVNLHVKTILQPAKTVGFINDPHAAFYLPCYYAVNENKEKVEGPFTKKVSVDKIQINHYFTKSKSEFIKKKNRGQATSEAQRTMDAFYFHDKNDIFDDSLRVYNERKSSDNYR